MTKILFERNNKQFILESKIVIASKTYILVRSFEFKF